ncbi:hypothetical protein EDD86DRAFT_203660 [Gorgonomyces haynaldii]|nr:hypothetical protein EDD86DRAFT_203660 [Gorgonomyces haynaldii]
MSQLETDHALAMLLQQEYDYFYDDEPIKPKRKSKDKEYQPKKKQSKRKSEDKPRELKPSVDGLNTGKFSDLELELFKSGLDLYGRDWGMLVQHIKTRDANAIRSHCQKYFIKLFRDRVPLPPKVVESGPGYTLSGKDLDPESAAAKPYLRGMQPPYPVQSGMPIVKQSIPVKIAIPPSLQSNTDPVKTDGGDLVKTEADLVKTEDTPPAKSAQKHTKKKKTERKIETLDRTDYAKSRPVRTQKPQIDPITLLASHDSHVMIPCGRYHSTPTNGPGSQPFFIRLHPRVNAVMDLHAHLLTTEVIGFLAGHWDQETKTLTVKHALPCKSVENLNETQADRHYNVELEPTSEVETRSRIEQLGLQVVGWYHSHPTFRPDPSLIDLFNQRSYQSLFRQDSADEPFVGAIVGPYDPHLPQSLSLINWFYVGNRQEDKNKPKKLEHTILNEPILESDLKSMLDLITECGTRNDRVDFTMGWRDDRWESKLDKLKISMEHQQCRKEWLQQLEDEIHRWPQLQEILEE